MYTQGQRQRSETARNAGAAAGPRTMASSPLAQLAADLNARPQVEALGALSERLSAPAQRMPNRTGLPDHLKAGVEALSGMSLDGINVHYNSSRPAQLGAAAYTQGADIHVAPGQERHLPHEAWHVVQQAQGRVPATLQLRGVAVNDDPALEAEADRMGAQALQRRPDGSRSASLRTSLRTTTALTPVQREKDKKINAHDVAKMVAVGGATFGMAALGLGVGVPALMLGGLAAAGTYFLGEGGGIGAGIGGIAGTIAGGALAGPAGALFGGAGGVLFGATGGADLLSNRSEYTKEEQGNIPSIGNVMIGRAFEKLGGTADMARASTERPQAKDVDEVLNTLNNDKLKIFLGERIAERGSMTGAELFQLLASSVDEFYGKANAMPDRSRDKENRKAVKDVLSKNKDVKKIASGEIFHGGPAEGNKSLGIKKPSKGKSYPKQAWTALDKFNAIVDKDGLPDIDSIERLKLEPASSISRKLNPFSSKMTSALNVGSVAPTDVIVHEYGHHLEHNLSPEEFATLHNFLRERSLSDKKRRVGMEHLVNKKQMDEGYDTDTPNPIADQQSSIPLTKLVFDGMRYGLFGSSAGERGINRFVQTQSHTERSSYATKIYDDGSTEFLSTTIHLLADAQTAQALIDKDPLRFCLFLYLGNRKIYNDVKNELSKKHEDLNLDDLIHAL